MLVLDEVQRIPDWSETVKGLWDGDRLRDCLLRVVILGSAPLLMQSGLSESLAGRFETIRVTHWSFAEMSEAFGFDLLQYLYFGGYPGAAYLVREPDRWRGYILGALLEPNIERDLLAMTRVDKPALLKRLFELGAECSGQIVSYTKMAGPAPRRREHDDPGALSRSAGQGRPARRTAEVHRQSRLAAGVHPQAQRAQHGPDDGRLGVLLRRGPGRPHLLGPHRRECGRRPTWLNTAESDMRLHYWREGQHEVDFVLKRGRRSVAVEVKSGGEGRPARERRPLRGMEEFERRFDRCRGLLVGEGGIPLNEFLTAPAGEWFAEAWA